MTSAPQFSLDVARQMAAASKGAYDGAPWAADPVSIQTPTCHVLILHCPLAITIACRGTASLTDFITDARALRRQFGDWPGTIHEGFGYSLTETDEKGVRSADKLIKQIMQALAEITLKLPNNPDRPIYVTGHSLGGAQAALIAHRLLAEDIPVTAIYTFGQPRVGDGKFRRAVTAAQAKACGYFRIVHEEDLIARIPGWLMGYRHAGTEEFLSSFSSPLSCFRIRENPPLWFKLLSDAWDLWQLRGRGPLAFGELLEDHHIDRYIHKLSLT